MANSIILFFVGLFFSIAQSDFKTVKKRIVAELMKSSVDDVQIQTIISTLKEDGTWPGIHYKDVSREGFLHRIHASNIFDLARAYKSKTSRFFKN